MTHPRTPPASEALALFRHSRIGPIFLAIFAAVLAGASGFVLYLSTILPASTRHAAAPIRYSHVNLVTPDNLSLHHGSSAFMAILVLIVLLQCYMVIRRRKSRFELHEDGVVHQIGETRTYAPFAAIQDVYLFASGQTALAGSINNFAYRTTPEQNWVLVSGELRGFDDFMDEFRTRHVAHRLPVLE